MKSREDISKAVTKDNNENACFAPWMFVERQSHRTIQEKKTITKKEKILSKNLGDKNHKNRFDSLKKDNTDHADTFNNNMLRM